MDKALQIFDALPPVPIDFMLGLWTGAEFPSGHPMDGLLSNSGWYGKRFKDAESVDPLLFDNANGEGFFLVDPAKMFGRRGAAASGKVAEQQTTLETKEPKARLRMMEYRGKVSATMIYDQLPINDMFRQVDQNTVLGAMDLRGVPQTYFFVLRRQ